MHKILLPLVVGMLSVSLSLAQEYRSIDGSGNNLGFPEWGKSGTTLKNIVSYQYGNGYSSPTGADRPNPRTISTTIFEQDGLLVDPNNLSDFAWVFGQLVDHEVTFVTDISEFFPIEVPAGDPLFDPFNTGQVIIPMNRSSYDPTTGTAVGNPRRHINSATAWLDASAVYGEEDERANWLRTFSEGKLKTSAGNLLPYNTMTGEKDAPIDPSAPHMDNAVGLASKIFVAGDARANENPLLIAYHTLFVREHNRMCDEILQKHPYFTDEEVYQHARKMVSGIFQNIVFNEWLPSMGLELPRYNGYNPYLDPRISNIFSSAAFRLGHTLLNGNINRIGADGQVIPEGNLELKDAFFNIAAFEDSGMDVLFKGMAVQIAQELDAKVVDDVRNFLFGSPGAGGLDLVSINIQRGRERGLPDFNTVRKQLGLEPYTDLNQISTNQEEVDALAQVYGDIDNIDVWVGLLMEDPMEGAIFGETLMKILKDQFLALRDGDRFFFENDSGLKYSEKNMIRNTLMVDVIRRNTNIEILQDHVFKAMAHDSVPQCESNVLNAGIEGAIQAANGLSLQGVEVELYDGTTMMPSEYSNELGSFLFEDLETCRNYVLIPYNDEGVDNGVTTADLIKIQKHILGIEKFASPYVKLAADANKSGGISTADLIAIRKVILDPITGKFPNNTSWRFMKSDYSFDGSDNPLMDDMPESVMVEMFSENMNVDFMAVKTGDVDGNANPDLNLLVSEERNFVDSYDFIIKDRIVEAGEIVRVPFYPGSSTGLAGFQLTIQAKTDYALLLGMSADDASVVGEGMYKLHGNAMTVCWNDFMGITPDDSWFVLELKALTTGRLSELINISSSITPAEAYDEQLRLLNLNLRFEEKIPVQVSDALKLYQNQPNPFRDVTNIAFYLPENKEVTISIADVTGKVLYVHRAEYSQGLQSIAVHKNELGAYTNGVLVCRMESGEYNAVKTMLLTAE